jgi:hypothetical protein
MNGIRHPRRKAGITQLNGSPAGLTGGNELSRPVKALVNVRPFPEVRMYDLRPGLMIPVPFQIPFGQPLIELLEIHYVLRDAILKPCRFAAVSEKARQFAVIIARYTHGENQIG